MALWPIHCAFGITKMIVSTYQAASGAGAEGMDELRRGIAAHVASGTVPPGKVFAHALPYNVIPHIDKFQPNRYTKEEMKVAWETRKIFHIDEESELRVSVTAVRVPTLRAHAEAISIQTALPVTPEAAAALLHAAPGVALVDNPAAAQYPMPLTATGAHAVEAGRLRQSLVFGDYGLELFVCGDQLLRGAALNAVLIARLVTAGGGPDSSGGKPAPRPRPPRRKPQRRGPHALAAELALVALPAAAALALSLGEGRRGAAQRAASRAVVFSAWLGLGALLSSCLVR